MLRCAVLEQHRQLSYEELAFHLGDSWSFRAFARLPWSWSPKKSVLQKTISAIRAETWEADPSDAAFERHRGEAGARPGGGLDSTVTAALMHEPSDSSLLWDAVRVMARLLQAAEALACRRRARMARSPAGGEEALAGHRVHPRAAQTGAALSRADQDHPRRPWPICGKLRLQLARSDRFGGRSLAGQGPPLSATDRADHRPDRAAGSAWRTGAGQRQAGQPVRTPCRHHPQGQRGRVRPQAQPDHRPERLDLDVAIEAGNPADSERLLPMLERHMRAMASRRVSWPPTAAMPVATI